MRGPAVRAIGLCSGWGRGAAALPADARTASQGRALLPLGRPPAGGERFRRATRECLWAIAAVEAMLEDAGASREAIAGERTALVYVTAAAYAASNRAFMEGSGATAFPYTAPAVVPAEVAIEFSLSGPTATLIGGAPAMLGGIWHGATLLERERCDRALVLAVETFEGCEDLYGRARGLAARPLVEAAGCLWLEPGEGTLALTSGRGGRPRDPGGLRPRIGEMFACEPLAALALWRERGGTDPLRLAGAWRGETAELRWTGARPLRREPARVPLG